MKCYISASVGTVMALVWLMCRTQHRHRCWEAKKTAAQNRILRFSVLPRWSGIFFLRYTWCIRNCLWGGACCSNHGDHARDKAWRYMATTAGTVKFKLLPVLLFYRISCSLVVQVLESRARSVKLRLKKRCWCTKALCDLALKLCCFC